MRRGRRVVIAGGYLLVGAVALAFTIRELDPGASPLLLLIGSALPAVLAGTLVAAVSWLAFWSGLSQRDVARVFRWSAVGMVALGIVVGVVVVAGAGRYTVAEPAFLLMNTVVGGAGAGIGIGLYDVLSRRQREQLLAERERLDVLNRMLRHHLLNGMNVILASAEELERREDGPPHQELRAIQERGDEVVALVERVSELTDDVHGQPDPEPRALREVLAEPVARAQAVYGTANVELDSELPDVDVRSDDTLGDAIETVLCERAESGGSVSVAAEPGPTTVRVRIFDTNGGSGALAAFSDGGDLEPVFSDSGDLVSDGERYSAGIDQGVDIYMAELLLSRSGGELDVRKGEVGPVIELSLPRA